MILYIEIVVSYIILYNIITLDIVIRYNELTMTFNKFVLTARQKVPGEMTTFPERRSIKLLGVYG
jgi:hypothetical protein